MKRYLLLAVLGACAVDELDTTTAIEAVTVTTGPGYIWSEYGNLYVGGLGGAAVCDDGTSAPSCFTDTVDFSLMPNLTQAQIDDLRSRFALADPGLANVSVIVNGQWRIVTVNDYRFDPPLHYRRTDFQLTSAYRTASLVPHSTTFFRLTGTTYQRAQQVSPGPHTLPFTAVVDFPGPVITNSYGVVGDGYVTGAIVQPPTVPAEIAADRYFQRL